MESQNGTSTMKQGDWLVTEHGTRAGTSYKVLSIAQSWKYLQRYKLLPYRSNSWLWGEKNVSEAVELPRKVDLGYPQSKKSYIIAHLTVTEGEVLEEYH